jgi:chorismate synthase
VTTFGESHGPAIGAVVDGLPSRIPVSVATIQRDLDRRRPGRDPSQSPRREPDQVEVLSGLLDEVTTGAPVAMVIRNRDARSRDYAALADLFRPGHADLTMQAKYGVRDARGGGRASGRETAARVAAGAIARQLLATEGIEVVAATSAIAGITAKIDWDAMVAAREQPLRCPDANATDAMAAAVDAARRDRDSVGGVVTVHARGVPAGLGEPVFDKLDARLAGALMSIGAVKAVEIGDGFAVAGRRGSENNDAIEPGPRFTTNHAGGILGGISNGDEIVARVAVKPTSSISQPQQTIDTQGEARSVTVQGRHDPCIVPRAVAVVEAMVCLVLADFLLLQQSRGHIS